MPVYSQASRMIIIQLHPELQRWLFSLIDVIDHRVVEGPRDRLVQQAKYEAHLTHIPGNGDAPHCRKPCEAVHLMPYPWPKGVSLNSQEARDRFHFFAGIALEHARVIQAPIRWGGDWNLNLNPGDNVFDDLMHFELRH